METGGTIRVRHLGVTASRSVRRRVCAGSTMGRRHSGTIPLSSSEAPMSYASIIVAVDPGKRAASRITMAAHLARRFDARLIGVAAWGPDYPRGYGETSVPAGYGVEDIRQKALAELVHAERAFRDVAKPAERIEWRSQLREPVGFLVEQSRAADLVVVGRRGENDRPHLVGAVGPGDALMATGRPVLVVPPAWRKCRRPAWSWRGRTPPRAVGRSRMRCRS